MRRLVAAVMMIVVGGCGEVELIDPLETDVGLEGAVFEVGATVGRTAVRLDFRGHAYGYERHNEQIWLRYLDAGRMLVAGRLAGRRFVRVGQPEYVLHASMPTAPSEVAVWIDGSGRVPACEVAVALPRARGPEAGAVVSRGTELVIPLAGVPDELVAGDRVRAEVHLASANGVVHSVALVPESTADGPALVVGPEVLDRVRPGPVEMTVTVVRERTHGFSDEESCARSQATVATYSVTAGVHLR